MEKLRTTHILLLFLVLLVIKLPDVTGQRSPFDPDVYREASLIKEYVVVFTDRSIYAVNECINLRADLIVEGLSEDRMWSSILYVELVSTTGTSLARAKFELSDQWRRNRFTLLLSRLHYRYPEVRYPGNLL